MSKLPDFARLRDSFLYAPMHTDINPAFCSGEWAKPIDHLLAAGYAFVGSRFTQEGYLFRGMSHHLLACLSTGEFGHFPGSNEVTQVEKTMNIFFVSHEISDALSVSSIYQAHDDGAILVFKASLFNQQLSQKQAAVLAVGDFGLVFRYPFLTRPIRLEEVEYIVCTTETAQAINQPTAVQIAEKLICIDSYGRRAYTEKIAERFNQLDITSAQPVRCPEYPKIRS